MLDVHNDTVPSSIMKLFTRTSNIHTYTTRSSYHNSLALSTQGLKCKKKKKKKAFSRVGVKVWNEMPNECKNLSKKSFNKETKRALLNILETEDSYIEPD